MSASDGVCWPSSRHSDGRTGQTAVAPSHQSWQDLGGHAVPGRRTGRLRTLLWTYPPTASKHHHEKPNDTKRVVSGKWQVASGKWQVVRGKMCMVTCEWQDESTCMSICVWVYVLTQCISNTQRIRADSARVDQSIAVQASLVQVHKNGGLVRSRSKNYADWIGLDLDGPGPDWFIAGLVEPLMLLVGCRITCSEIYTQC